MLSSAAVDVLATTYIVTCFLCYGGLIQGALTLVARRRFYAWEREVSRTSTEVALSMFYAPMLSAAAAVVAGLGVNIFTGDDNSALSIPIGIVYVLVGVGILAWGGRGLARMAIGKGAPLARVRHRLNAVEHPDLGRTEHSDALTYARRVTRVGERLMSRSQALTFRTWMRSGNRRALRTMAPPALAGGFLVFLSIRLSISMVEHGWVFLGLTAGAAVAGFIVPYIRWIDARWTLRAVGRELSEEGRRTESYLRRHIPAPTWRERVLHLLPWRHSPR